MAQLSDIREALKQINDYNLPDRYTSPVVVLSKNDEGNGNNKDGDGGGGRSSGDDNDASSTSSCYGLDENLIRRYREARTRYVNQRIQKLLLEHVTTYDPETGTFDELPSSGGDNEEGASTASASEAAANELRERRRRRQLEEIRSKAQSVADKSRQVRVKYLALDERRVELAHMVGEIEAQEERKNKKEEDGLQKQQQGDDVGEEVATEKEEEESEVDDDVEGKEEDGAFQQEEERVAALAAEKEELQAKLLRIQGETRQAVARRDELRRTIQELMPQPTADREEGEGVIDAADDENKEIGSTTTLLTPEAVQERIAQIRAETKTLHEKEMELVQCTEWYDKMNLLLEELSGMRILRVREVPNKSATHEEDGESSGGGAKNTGAAADDDDSTDWKEKDLEVDIQLLNEYTLRVGLSTGGRTRNASGGRRRSFSSSLRRRNGSNNNGGQDRLQVSSAVLLGDVVIQGEDGVVKASFPSLDDLVEMAGTIAGSCSRSSNDGGDGGGEDIRFVAREALARVRATRERVDELVLLRKKYLTKIHAEVPDEVVCTLNEGIVVVLRLTEDCPLLPGSVYIDQIVGVGGWDKKDLEQMKDTANAKMSKGPVQLMDELAREVQLSGKAPVTPTLPVRRMR